MNEVFKKLNYKGQEQVFILNAPLSFNKNIESIEHLSEVKNKVSTKDEIEFLIVFATKRDEVSDIVKIIAPKLIDDAVLWIAYPKGTSKNYTSDFNRDTGWDIMGDYNLEPVRSISIDNDWTALRFRKVQYIKRLTRDPNWILSVEGQKLGAKSKK